MEFLLAWVGKRSKSDIGSVLMRGGVGRFLHWEVEAPHRGHRARLADAVSPVIIKNIAAAFARSEKILGKAERIATLDRTESHA
jgi:hypothetical protein